MDQPSPKLRLAAMAATALALLAISVPFVWEHDVAAEDPAVVADEPDVVPASLEEEQDGAVCMTNAKPAKLDFTIKDLDGKDVSLTSFKGKVILLNFWATWCGPCWEEHPVLVATAQSNPQVQFLGVVFQDTDEKILSFLQQRGSSYPTVVDDKGKTAIAYGVGGVPETFFLDANGVIVSKFSGPISQMEMQEELRKVVQ